MVQFGRKVMNGTIVLVMRASHPSRARFYQKLMDCCETDDNPALHSQSLSAPDRLMPEFSPRLGSARQCAPLTPILNIGLS